LLRAIERPFTALISACDLAIHVTFEGHPL
jgi:hypothetical protein